jgi:hypothetical protein
VLEKQLHQQINIHQWSIFCSRRDFLFLF